MVTHQLQVERRTAKGHRPKTDALPLDHTTVASDTHTVQYCSHRCLCKQYVVLADTACKCYGHGRSSHTRGADLGTFYFALGRGAKYCDERVCMSVCLSLCLSSRTSQKRHVKTSRNFMCVFSCTRFIELTADSAWCIQD